MEFLAYTIYGNSVQTWALALGIALVTLGVLVVTTSFIVRNLRRLSSRTSNELDNMAAAVLDRTRTFFLVAIAVIAAAQILVLPDQVRHILKILGSIAFLLQVAIWGNAAIGVTVERYAARRLEQDAEGATSMRFVAFLLRAALWLLISLVALDTAGIEITALVAGLGIGGIAVALAVQNVLGDLLASLSIMLDKPFVLGDFIIVGDLSGTVEHIGLKTTRVRSLSGEQLVFSNNDLLSSRIRNYKRMRERRIVFRFGLLYDTPPETLERIPALVREIVENQGNARYDRAHFAAFGDSSLDFEVVYFMLVADYDLYMDTQQAINFELFRRIPEIGADFAFPTRTIHIAGGLAVAAGPQT